MIGRVVLAVAIMALVWAGAIRQAAALELQWDGIGPADAAVSQEIGDFLAAVAVPAGSGDDDTGALAMASIVEQRVARILAAHGYLDARVNAAPRERLETLTIAVGPRYRLGAVIVTGLDPELHGLLPGGWLASVTQSSLGVPLDEARLDKVALDLSQQLRFLSYGHAAVHGRLLEKNAGELLATWQIKAEPGVPVIAGKLVLEGVTRANAEDILRGAPELEGLDFRPTMIEDIQSYLEGQWNFADAEVFLRETPNAGGTTDIVARVNEPLLTWEELNAGWTGTIALSTAAVLVLALHLLFRELAWPRRWLRASAGISFLLVVAAAIGTIQRLLFLLYP